MSTILEIVQDLASEIGLPVPSALVGSASSDAKQYLAIAHEQGELLRTHNWPQLVKELTFTLSTSDPDYVLPVDFDHWVYDTQWDQSQDYPLIGPINPQEWQRIKQSVVGSAAFRKKFRVRGYGSSGQTVSGAPIPGINVLIDPVPTSAENGQTLIGEYASRTWILPKQWVTSTSFAAGSYCSNAGNIYKTTAGGTTGATPPTHTTGSASDGTVTWAHQSNPYYRFLADTDFPLIPARLLKAAIKYRFLAENLLDFGIAKTTYDELFLAELSGIRGATVVDLEPRYSEGLYENIPAGNFEGEIF